MQPDLRETPKGTTTVWNIDSHLLLLSLTSIVIVFPIALAMLSTLSCTLAACLAR